jgi:recombination protein RecR
MEFAPASFHKLIDHFSSLPGIGKRGARRIVLHLMTMPADQVESFAQSIQEFRSKAGQCRECGNISMEELCTVCSDRTRTSSLLCIVEKVQDALAIEGTNDYRGLYHILHGRIDPLNNKGPELLNTDTLLDRIDKRNIREVIIATSLDLEGETTASFIADLLSEKKLVISRPASGIPVGTDLEYSDPVTLVRAMRSRVKMEE